MNQTDDKHGELAKALRSYEQADADGVFVKVSRQACDEAAALIESLSARSAIVTPEKIEDAVRAHLGTSDRAQMLIDDIKKLFVLGGNTDGGTNEEAK